MRNASCTCSKPASEPFRLFFPAGMILGIIGVGLWPLFQAGSLPYYPSIAHTRLMTEGFAAAFIFGFLMTAGPRLLGVPAFPRKLVALCFVLTIACCTFHLLQLHAVGDALFAITCLVVLTLSLRSYLNRNDIPPPGFPLAALGIACAAIGAGLLSLYSLGWHNYPAYTGAKALLFQGFTLLPIIGVGGFFFPKILGGRNLHDFPVMSSPNEPWKRHFRYSVLTGIGFIASVLLEAFGYIAIAYTLRTLVIGSYLIASLQLKEFSWKKSPHGTQLIFALSSIFIGFLGVIFFPNQKAAWLHAYFVVGLTGAILLVSLRVVFGHSGRIDRIPKSILIFGGLIGLLFLSAASRIFADFAPLHQQSHYLYAAICWLICGVAWSLFVGPYNIPSKKGPNGNC